MKENPYKAPATIPIEDVAQPRAIDWQRARYHLGAVAWLVVMVILAIAILGADGWLTPLVK